VNANREPVGFDTPLKALRETPKHVVVDRLWIGRGELGLVHDNKSVYVTEPFDIRAFCYGSPEEQLDNTVDFLLECLLDRTQVLFDGVDVAVVRSSKDLAKDLLNVGPEDLVLGLLFCLPQLLRDVLRLAAEVAASGATHQPPPCNRARRESYSLAKNSE